ncbi:aminotransferase class I/II-fold pyridoxal phosphate-dependent enzyme [Nonomuraea sp. NPDC004297]
MARESAASDAWHSASRQGDRGLREVLASILGDAPERLMITSGVRSGVGVLSRGVRRVLHERPSFAGTVQAFRGFGVPVELVGWDKLPEAVRVDDPADSLLLWVTHPLRNPDGATLDPAKWRQLRQLSSGRLRVVANEVYRWHTTVGPDPHGPPATMVGSFAKLAGTGSTLGWIRTADVHAVMRFQPSRPPLLWQRCWRYLLERGAIERFVEASVLPSQRAARVFLHGLGSATLYNVTPPFILLTVAGLRSDELVAQLAEKGILAGSGFDFLAPEPAVRLAFAGLGSSQAETAAAIISRNFAGRYRLSTPDLAASQSTRIE